MCGIFGMVRAQDSDPTWASNVFVALGHLAEERGSDAAGFALVGENGPVSAAGPPGAAGAAGCAGAAGAAGAAGSPGPVSAAADDAIHRREADLGVCRVVKDTRRWGLLWRREYVRGLDASRAAFGHTRHASQGDPATLVNASPLVVGEALVGVHNGDIDADALRRDLPAGIPPSRGGTDSEVLLLALDGVRGDLLGACDVLETVRGLATVAWLDRSAPELVFLARGALCPLAIATDARGNLYWASSPSWFRRLDERSGGRLGFEVEQVPEGMLLAIAASGSPLIRARCSFEPIARPGDDWRFPSIWNGVDRVDVEAFQAEASHRTAPSSPAAREPALARTAAPVG
jgi:glutamine phosphoribosylpyrophosphate amidotransferase